MRGGIARQSALGGRDATLDSRASPSGVRVGRTASVIVVAALAVAGFAAEPRLEIADVVLEGNRAVHPDRVRFVIEARAGKTFTQSALQQAVADDVKAIERMGPFTSTRSELVYGDDGRTVKVVYRFKELPYVADIRWETYERLARQGGRLERWEGQGDWEWGTLGYFDKDSLEKVIETKTGSWLNPMLMENDRRAVLRKLYEDGRRHARVEVEQREKDGAVTVVFRVDRGRDVEVGRVEVEGLPAELSLRIFDPGILNPQGLLNAAGKPYQPELVPLDEGSVVRTLQDLGWLDAKLIRTRREMTDLVRPTDERRRHGPELVPDGEFNDRVVLIYTIEAGSRYRLGKVQFVGNTVASSADLREAFRMAEGDWFKRTDLYGDGGRASRRGDDGLGAIERSRRVVSNQGYARCEVRVDRRVDTAKHIVDLTLHVEEGRKYRIGRVEVHGNRVTRDSVVRRALYLNPGDRWSDDESDESLRQVERTGVFNGPRTPPRPLRIEKNFPEDRPDEVDLEVQVDERSTGSLNFQLGYSTASGVFGSLGYTESNFDILKVLSGEAYRGANQSLSFQLFAGEDRTSVSASWSDPHIFDGPHSLGLSGFRSDSTALEWREIRTGGTATVGRYFLRDDLLLQASYGYTNLKVKDVSYNAPDDAVTGNFYWNTLGLAQTYDRVNDRQTPTSGYVLTTGENFNGAPLSGSSDWLEVNGKAIGFVPLHQTEEGGVTFLKLAGRYRQEWAIDDSFDVPFYARYRGGGSAPAHRGFEQYRLSPTAYNRWNYFSYTGGTLDVLFTGELSYPVQQINEGLRVVGFVDYGNVWGEGESISPTHMRTAVGLGIRLPQAMPISLDFAWLLGRRESHESGTQIHFGMSAINF
jgi:outer membrane protein assembly complex protein YaeT